MDETTPLLGPTRIGTRDDLLGERIVDQTYNGNYAFNDDVQTDHTLFEGAVQVLVEMTETIVEGVEEIREALLHGEAKSVRRARKEGDHTRKLSAAVLAVLIFYKVSGGSFGYSTLRRSRPWAVLCDNWLWAVPETLVNTSELDSAYPSESY